MDYPVIYSAETRVFSGFGIAVLEEAQNVKIKQVINGEYTLSLMLPRTSEKWQFIEPENFVYVDGQAFRIRGFEEIRDTTGRLTSNIQCEHACYDLNDIKHLPKMRDIVNVTPQQVFVTGFEDSDGDDIDGILQGTDFTFSSEDVGSTDLFLSKCTPRAVLNEFLTALDCEVEFDNYHINIVQQCGEANSGVVFSVGKNITEIKRTTDSTGLCTRLYPYGADYLDITSVNTGRKAYIDSPLINHYDYPHEDFRDYPEIDNPSDLLEKAQQEWSTEEKDGIDKPKVTYSLSVLELKKIPEYATFQRFCLGDTVTVQDEFLGINVKARIMEYEFYPYEPKRSTVVLANFRPNLGGLFADIAKNQNIIKQITNKRGEVIDEFIESVQKTMSVKFNDALSKKTIVYDYANMWVDDMDNPTSAIALVDGMFAMANNKDENGLWNWRTIGGANGLIADSVISTWVYAGKIEASQINAGTINTSKITLDSGDGKLTISSNKITMKTSNGSRLLINPTDGLIFEHTFDSSGRVLQETVMNKRGAFKRYTKYNDDRDTITTGANPYIDCVCCETCGGGNWPEVFAMDLTGLSWAQYNEEEGKQLYTIVSPAEMLRFCTPNGGRVNDLLEYECYVDSYESLPDGVRINVVSRKRYVSKIVNNAPVYSTGSLKFNILAIMQ